VGSKGTTSIEGMARFRVLYLLRIDACKIRCLFKDFFCSLLYEKHEAAPLSFATVQTGLEMASIVVCLLFNSLGIKMYGHYYIEIDQFVRQ